MKNDESANSNSGTRIKEEVVGAGKGVYGIYRTSSEETYKINEQEYNWGLDFMREMERRQNQQNNANNFRLLRIDFLRYDGGPIKMKIEL
jgi:hypothetical protein